MARRPELMVMSGDLAGRRFTVPPAGLRLGRSSSNDIHVPDEELSRSHCVFECEGDDAIRVVDLASANGTYVNGEQLGSDARMLVPGDVVEAGAVRISVVAEGQTPPAVPTPVPGKVDLGLDSASAAGALATGQSAPAAKRSSLASILLAAGAVAVAAAIGIVLCFPGGGGGQSRPAQVVQAQDKTPPKLVSLSYEKVEADAARIFRYQMTVDPTGILRVVYDDVPSEDRHVDKSMKLSDRAAARIVELLTSKGWNELESVYSGPSASSENSLRSWRIRAIIGTKVREVTVENVTEPEAFATVREALETLSRNELGIWALQYSRDKLIELSADSARIGDSKWSERDVEYGNLSAGVKAYREAVFYLETVNPKPEGYAGLKEKLVRAEAELEARYKDQRFLADKAINLGDWETARRELRVLCDMVPDKDDQRHIEANAKLVDVENRMKKAKKKGGAR
ncbi:MAG: FHA domain-containing protein [Kiritimatiellae bacterium]|nr:FHA domain-containing protein [Kiritimatiellia bacterium]